MNMAENLNIPLFSPLLIFVGKIDPPCKSFAVFSYKLWTAPYTVSISSYL